MYLRSSRKTFVAIASIVILALAIGTIWYFTRTPENNDIKPVPLRTTLTGVYLCLPLTDEKAKPEKCDRGMKTEEGNYYVLDFGLLSSGVPELPLGVILQATGIITPIETLNTDYWHKYPVRGIFSVTDTLKAKRKDGSMQPVVSQ